ncbi:MAG: alpha/beta hydrolase [Candidatus Binatia bacterium]
MRSLTFLLTILMMLAAACAPRPALRVAASPAAAPVRVRDPIGVTSRLFIDDTRDRKLATTIWYPAAAGSVQHEIEWDGIFIGHGAWNVPLRASPQHFPIVLLSHGSGADASNLTWLAEPLAARGYVVVAVDHPGDRFGDSSQEGRFAAWRRPGDVRVALDRVLADPALGPRLDRTRIAAAGHSSGAYTVLALAGARLNPRAYLAYCGGHGRGPDCKLFDDLDPKNIPDLTEAGRSGRDSRVRAVLALAPVLGPGIDAASLRRIRVPATIVASPTDSVVPFKLNAARYQRFLPQSRIAKVPGDHFVFMPMCTFAGRVVAAQVCVDGRGVDRQAIHDQVIALALAFFDRQLHVATPHATRGPSRVRPRH